MHLDGELLTEASAKPSFVVANLWPLT